MRYRRARVGGGRCFFTVNLAKQHPSLLVDSLASLLRLKTSEKIQEWYTSLPT